MEKQMNEKQCNHDKKNERKYMVMNRKNMTDSVSGDIHQKIKGISQKHKDYLNEVKPVLVVDKQHKLVCNNQALRVANSQTILGVGASDISGGKSMMKEDSVNTPYTESLEKVQLCDMTNGKQKVPMKGSGHKIGHINRTGGDLPTVDQGLTYDQDQVKLDNLRGSLDRYLSSHTENRRKIIASDLERYTASSQGKAPKARNYTSSNKFIDPANYDDHKQFPVFSPNYITNRINIIDKHKDFIEFKGGLNIGSKPGFGSQGRHVDKNGKIAQNRNPIREKKQQPIGDNRIKLDHIKLNKYKIPNVEFRAGSVYVPGYKLDKHKNDGDGIDEVYGESSMEEQSIRMNNIQNLILNRQHDYSDYGQKYISSVGRKPKPIPRMNCGFNIE